MKGRKSGMGMITRSFALVMLGGLCLSLLGCNESGGGGGSSSGGSSSGGGGSGAGSGTIKLWNRRWYDTDLTVKVGDATAQTYHIAVDNYQAIDFNAAFPLSVRVNEGGVSETYTITAGGTWNLDWH